MDYPYPWEKNLKKKKSNVSPVEAKLPLRDCEKTGKRRENESKSSPQSESE